MVNETQIEEVLKQLPAKLKLEREPAGLYDPMKYVITMAGKMVRPRLCLTTYSLFKDSFDDSIILPAAALEVFHNFTLIHDDIMDKASIRRGQPTVCKKWNDNVAILSGDAMCIESFRLIANAPVSVRNQVWELFSSTAMQVCEGQQYDMDYEQEKSISMKQYIDLIGLKTAVLIACSAKMGALIAGANERACEYLYKFGYFLGLAFQIADDYLDVFGDSSIFGKTIGGDILNNKKSWLLTRAMEKSGEMEESGMLSTSYGKKSLLAAMSMKPVTEAEKEAKINKVKEIYEEIGVDEDAKYEIIKLHARAMEFAGMIGLGKVRFEVLNRYADKLIGRTK